ncbi:MAG TPA: TlpA disulfide reductase family protein [Phycisphaerae bacterium]|nr:TlpA disulfide reductase family protein [Phycisphaerae bacterium]
MLTRRLKGEVTLVAVGVLLACSGAWAQEGNTPGAEAGPDQWASSRLGKTILGEHWLGAEVEAADLRGQVVLLEFWGYRCGPCIASIPHISKLNTKYSKHGLAVIGAHAQGSQVRTEAVTIAIARGANYTILSGASVPEADFSGIPHAFVFDHAGRVVFEGHPSDRKMEQAIVAALKARPHPILGEMQYRKMASAAAKARAGRLGEAIKLCQAKAGAEGDEGKEASYLLANIERYAGRLQAKADKYEQDAPSRCLAALAELDKRFAGTDYGEKAKAKLTQLKEDKTFQSELKAEKLYEPIARAGNMIPPYPAEQADRAGWTRKYGTAARGLKNRVEALKKQYPDSRFVAKAETVLAQIQGS